MSVEEVPVSDGGEGFLDCIEMAKSQGDDRVERIPVEVKGALPGQIKKGSVLVNEKIKSAYIETADLSGLQDVPIGQRNPFITTSFGVG